MPSDHEVNRRSTHAVAVTILERDAIALTVDGCRVVLTPALALSVARMLTWAATSSEEELNFRGFLADVGHLDATTLAQTLHEWRVSHGKDAQILRFVKV